MITPPTPGGRLGMTDVGFQRPQPQRPIPPLPISRQQSLRLNRITECRTRAMSLHRIHLAMATDPAGGQGLTNHPLLGGPIRGSQAIGRTILIHRTATHHGQHRMPKPLCVAERRSTTSTPTPSAQPVPIGSCGERLAPTIRSQTTLPGGNSTNGTGAGHHRHTTDQSYRALAAAQRLGRQMQRHQRRRTRGIYRHRWSLQPEDIGTPGRT